MVGIACEMPGRQFILGDKNPDCPNIYAHRAKDRFEKNPKRSS